MMRLAALFLLFFASAASAGTFNPVTYTLANGMQIVVVVDNRSAVVQHMVWYRVGAADEPPGKSGIAHFLEHLMFKGTPTVPPGEFSKIIARNGGRDNAFTSRDYTGYFQTVAADKLELVMRMEADRMANLTLDVGEVEREREVILEERRARTENEPAALLGEQMTAALYLAHPYRIPVIGWMHEMQGLTREDAIAFYKAHYAPNNAILAISGDVDPAAVKALAEKYYGVIPAGSQIVPRMRLKEPPQIAPRRVILEDQRVKQPSLSRTYLAPSHATAPKPEAHALDVLSEILGNSRTGRLYRALVAGDGPAVSAGAWYQGDGLDSGSFGFTGRPRQGVTLPVLEAAIDKVIAELLEKGVTPEEVTLAKKGLIAGAVFARDSVGAPARIFGEALTTGTTVEDVEAWPERIDAVRPEDVMAAARKVLDLRRSVTGFLLPKPTS